MAYVPDKEQDQEEKKAEEAKYGALFAPPAGEEATPMTGGATAAPVAAPAPKKMGFVSADRYLNANRDTVNRMNTEAKADLTKRTESVKTGLANTTAEIQKNAVANTLGGPYSGHGVTTDDALAASGPPETIASAQAKAAQTYAGPTSTDVSNKYGSLFSDFGKLREDTTNAQKYGLGATQKWNAFDSALSNAAGGQNVAEVSNQLGGIEKDYTDSRAAAEAAVNSASASHDENNKDSAAAKWAELAGLWDKEQTDAATAATNKQNDLTSRKWDDLYGAVAATSGNAGLLPTGKRPAGADLVSLQSFEIAPGKSANQFDLKMGPGSSEKIAKAFDKMSDDDALFMMQAMSGMGSATSPFGSPEQAKALYNIKHLLQKYGVK